MLFILIVNKMCFMYFFFCYPKKGDAFKTCFKYTCTLTLFNEIIHYSIATCYMLHEYWIVLESLFKSTFRTSRNSSIHNYKFIYWIYFQESIFSILSHENPFNLKVKNSSSLPFITGHLLIII